MDIKDILNRKFPCLAPHHTLYFDKNGKVSVCCKTKSYSIGKWPEQSIKEIWVGNGIKQMRLDMANHKFPDVCMNSCINPIKKGNYENVMLKVFDDYKNYKEEDNKYPMDITFELSNICNYECIMCGGENSSSIRKNRECLPKIKNIYNDSFIEQLIEFIPYLKIVKFYGGEPFLYDLNYKILDEIIKINPDVNISITTNGSILNEKMENYFKKLKNLKLTISMDSINETTYEKIRKNGNYKNVMSNINHFLEKKVLFGLAICPMLQNILEIPDIIKYCIKNGIEICFNRTDGAIGGYIQGIHEIPLTSIKKYTDSEIINILLKNGDFCIENNIKLLFDNNEVIGASINEIFSEIKDIPSHCVRKKEPPLLEKIPIFTINSLTIEKKIEIRTFLKQSCFDNNFPINICNKIDGLINEYLLE